MTILNIGTETIVEFLKSKRGLEPAKALNPNSKLTDTQYEALLREFAPDMRVKEKASHLFNKKSKKQKLMNKQDSQVEKVSNKETEKEKEKIHITPVTELSHDDNKDKEVVSISLSKLYFEPNCISYKKDTIEFALWESGISHYLNSERSNPQINNVTTHVILDYETHTFQFADTSVLSYLIDLSTRIENDKFEKHLKNVEKKKLKEKNKQQQEANKKSKEGITVESSPKVIHNVLLSAIEFSYGLAYITYKKKRYVYRDRRIWAFGKILSQIFQRLPKARKNSIRHTLIKIEIDIANGTFVFLDIDICKYINSLKESFLPEKNNEVSQEYKSPKEKKVIKTSLSAPTERVLSLRADNIHFYNGYYLISLPANKENSKSITPYRVNDRESNEVLNLVHKYFEQRFEQMRIVVRYNETKILEPSKLDQLQLSNYVRSLQRNIDVKGEWWEEVQNVRKRTLSQCQFELNTDIKRKAIKAKNDYLYNLSNLQNDKKLIRVYEINHGKEEDAFIFTITMPNDRCAVIFENASNDASTTTWVFVAKNENYEACVNLVFDYFTDYTISSKRSSLRDANTNPPYKFKAESYTFADHNDLGQWLRKMDKILERTSHRDTIEFIPGLNIPQTTNIRAGHNEAITTKNIHNELMQKLYDRLCQEHGEKNVGTEIRVGTRRIDAVVRGSDCFDIYEVKADPNPFNCVTEALGQICQYAYLYCRDKIGRMVIVGSSATTSEVENYLSWFREKHSLQVYYKKVEL